MSDNPVLVEILRGFTTESRQRGAFAVVDADGRIVGVFGISRDVTQRRQQDVQLRQLSLAVEQSSENILITDLDANIVYANVVLPGQELSVHTDVPEFRGANRKHEPEWLLVVMPLSGLFERWRMPIATGVRVSCEGLADA